MKKFLPYLLVIGLVLLLWGCSKSSVKSGGTVELRYRVNGHDIQVTLPEEEAEKVIGILNGNTYSSFLEGIPSCGFDADVSFEVDGRVYCIAGDKCGTVRDQSALKFFYIEDDEIAYIHSLFEKYGGKFPWI